MRWNRTSIKKQLIDFPELQQEYFWVYQAFVAKSGVPGSVQEPKPHWVEEPRGFVPVRAIKHPDMRKDVEAQGLLRFLQALNPALGIELSITSQEILDGSGCSWYLFATGPPEVDQICPRCGNIDRAEAGALVTCSLC